MVPYLIYAERLSFAVRQSYGYFGHNWLAEFTFTGANAGTDVHTNKRTQLQLIQ